MIGEEAGHERSGNYMSESQESELEQTQPYERQPTEDADGHEDSKETEGSKEHGGAAEAGTGREEGVSIRRTDDKAASPGSLEAATGKDLQSHPSTASSECDLTQPYHENETNATEHVEQEGEPAAVSEAGAHDPNASAAGDAQDIEMTQPFVSSGSMEETQLSAADTPQNRERSDQRDESSCKREQEGATACHDKKEPEGQTLQAGIERKETDEGNEQDADPWSRLPVWLQKKRFKFIVSTNEEVMEEAKTAKIPRKRKRIRPTASSDDEEQAAETVTTAEPEEPAVPEPDPADWRERTKFLIRVLSPPDVVAVLGPGKAKKLKGGSAGQAWSPEEEGLTEQTLASLQNKMMEVLQRSKFAKLTR